MIHVTSWYIQDGHRNNALYIIIHYKDWCLTPVQVPPQQLEFSVADKLTDKVPVQYIESFSEGRCQFCAFFCIVPSWPLCKSLLSSPCKTAVSPHTRVFLNPPCVCLLLEFSKAPTLTMKVDITEWVWVKGRQEEARQEQVVELSPRTPQATTELGLVCSLSQRQVSKLLSNSLQSQKKTTFNNFSLADAMPKLGEAPEQDPCSCWLRCIGCSWLRVELVHEFL